MYVSEYISCTAAQRRPYPPIAVAYEYMNIPHACLNKFVYMSEYISCMHRYISCICLNTFHALLRNDALTLQLLLRMRISEYISRMHRYIS